MENYKLDSAAKLFPSVTSKNNSSVFRLAVILKAEIDPKYLQLAINLIYERYSHLFKKMRKGIFWNYFDKNYSHFLIEKECTPPCSTIFPTENNGFIIKVLYYNNRISVEAFHSLTDGSGISEVVKSLIYYYIILKYEKISHENKVILCDSIMENDIEDSFNKNFRNLKINKLPKKEKEVNAYRIKGKSFKKGGFSVEKSKKFCKKNDCTITEILITNMIYTIYKANPKNIDKKIVIAVPVNLRKLFKSTTLNNFFGVVNIGYYMNDSVTFEVLLRHVSKELRSKVNEDNLKDISIKNVNMSKNVISKNTPLLLKNIIVPIGFNLFGEDKKTITISNIGKFDIPDGMKKYINHTEVLLYPTSKSPINCGVCSFEDNLTISFTSRITDLKIIKSFIKELSKQTNQTPIVYSNIWGEEDE